jgi:hypothetical protein
MSAGERTLDLRSMARASRRAGWSTAIGALIIFASLAYSGWNLSQKRAQLASLTTQLDSLSAQLSSVNNQIEVARSQRDDLLRELRELQDRLTALKRQQPGLAAQLPGLPIEAAVVPRASKEPYRRGEKNGDHFVFSTWLEVPGNRAAEIREVTYFFNHPTFREPRMVSRDGSNGFRVQYVGWGCLDRVIITLRLSDGSTRPLDFDMCSALGRPPR